MIRRHRMPFGASVEEDGVAFSLWAPAARRVDLRLKGARGEGELPMKAMPNGWFSAFSPAARPGDRYAFVLDGATRIPDPASRRQPDDVHGDSEIVDPAAFRWSDTEWRGRPWEEAVFYELHVGTFTPEGTYAAAADKLDYLATLGVTAIELMPLAEVPGARNWGYDGVFPFAPESRYGTPEDLKALICAAHRRNLMVFLDVVYNHLGPEGNYLWAAAPDFFTERHQTPWGVGIDFDTRVARDFFIHNALYWIEEYGFDGLRLDAVQAIRDRNTPHILDEIADAVRRIGDHHIHLVLENDDNRAALLARGPDGRPRSYVAQWNDDFHHALHVLITGETDGYYMDYADNPAGHLARALAEGFAYQGERSRYREGRPRGEPSADLPPTAFVGFLQNHDQVGNRPQGERIASLASPSAARAGVAIVLLSPAPPLLFMGEEWGSRQPFHFFCDFAPELADRIRAARRTEIAVLFQAADLSTQASIMDPTAPEAFQDSVLHWVDARFEPHAAWLALYQRLLRIRHAAIIPRLAGVRSDGSAVLGARRRAVTAQWRLGDGSRLRLVANLDSEEAQLETPIGGTPLYTTDPTVLQQPTASLPPWFVTWFLDAYEIVP